MNSLNGSPELPREKSIKISAVSKKSNQEQTPEVKNSSQKSSGLNGFGHHIVKEADEEGIGSKMQHKLWRGKSDEQNSPKNIPAQKRSSVELSSEKPPLSLSKVKATSGSFSPQVERKSSGIFASRLNRTRSDSESSSARSSSPIFSRKSVSNSQEETDRQVDSLNFIAVFGRASNPNRAEELKKVLDSKAYGDATHVIEGNLDELKKIVIGFMTGAFAYTRNAINGMQGSSRLSVGPELKLLCFDIENAGDIEKMTGAFQNMLDKLKSRGFDENAIFHMLEKYAEQLEDSQFELLEKLITQDQTVDKLKGKLDTVNAQLDENRAETKNKHHARDQFQAALTKEYQNGLRRLEIHNEEEVDFGLGDETIAILKEVVDECLKSKSDDLPALLNDKDNITSALAQLEIKIASEIKREGDRQTHDINTEISSLEKRIEEKESRISPLKALVLQPANQIRKAREIKKRTLTAELQELNSKLNEEMIESEFQKRSHVLDKLKTELQALETDPVQIEKLVAENRENVRLMEERINGNKEKLKALEEEISILRIDHLNLDAKENETFNGLEAQARKLKSKIAAQEEKLSDFQAMSDPDVILRQLAGQKTLLEKTLAEKEHTGTKESIRAEIRRAIESKQLEIESLPVDTDIEVELLEARTTIKEIEIEVKDLREQLEQLKKLKGEILEKIDMEISKKFSLEKRDLKDQKKKIEAFKAEVKSKFKEKMVGFVNRNTDEKTPGLIDTKMAAYEAEQKWGESEAKGKAQRSILQAQKRELETHIEYRIALDAGIKKNGLKPGDQKQALDMIKDWKKNYISSRKTTLVESDKKTKNSVQDKINKRFYFIQVILNPKWFMQECLPAKKRSGISSTPSRAPIGLS